MLNLKTATARALGWAISVGVAVILGWVWLTRAAPATAHGPTLPPAPQRAGAGPRAYVEIFVDRSDDGTLQTCSAAADDCTLRGAINKANADAANIYTIYFSPTVTLIALLNPLPKITANETWIVGASGVPRIDALFMAAGDVFAINASQVNIAGLSIVNGHNSNSALADIFVEGGTQNRIENNYLGTLPGNANVVSNCTPNPGGGSAVTRNSANGIYVGNVATGTSGVGNGAVYIYGNRIGCHDYDGIAVWGTDYVYIGQMPDHSAAGNYIGVNSFSVPITNGRGIDLRPSTNAPRYAQIANNFIANNAEQGILLMGNGTPNFSGTSSNNLISNTIGLAPNGTARGNGVGVQLTNGAFQNFIGGDEATEANVIAGNLGHGVELLDAAGNGVLGNFIGTNQFQNAMPNLGAGVRVAGGEANIIGGALYGLIPATRGNYIAYNGLEGVRLTSLTANNLIIANNILHNGRNGMALDGGANQNVIGGSGSPEANTIALNTGYGVSLAGTGTTTNTLKNSGINYNTSDNVTLQDGASGNSIGGQLPEAKNIIGYGQASGLYLSNAPNNQLYYNDVINNAFYGLILDGAGTSGTYISRTTFANNTYDGIGERNGADLNVWTEVQIYDNGGLGVDKDASNDDANGVNPPVASVTAVTSLGGGVYTLQGTGLNGTLIEVYGVALDPSGMGEGKFYIGTATVSSGQWSLTLGSANCFTFFENALGVAASEFGPNTCRQMLPLVRR